MPFLLDCVYLLLLVAASPWLLYEALRRGKYRQSAVSRFVGRVPVRRGSGPCIWLHAVSVGEVNLLQPLLARLEQQLPQWEFVISTTTRTGFDLARQRFAPRSVFYSPLDFSWAVRRSLRRVRPTLLLLVELELWPNLIRAARRSGAPVAVVNGRLSESSAQGYRRIRPFVAGMLRSLELIAVQNEQYANRFLELGAVPDTVHVTGSLKFDGATSDRDNPQTRRLIELAGIDPRDAVFLAGSTQYPEESMALESFRALRDEYPQLRLILVPRHPERFEEVAAMLNRSGVCWQRRSELQLKPADPQARVLLVDAVGELGAWWGTAQIAFVGGSMGTRGGQNMIEPAAYGAAVSFGPNTRNFRDVTDALLRHDAAAVVHDGVELTAWVRRCLEDPAYARQLGHRARELVALQAGATDRTVRLIQALIDRHGNL